MQIALLPNGVPVEHVRAREHKASWQHRMLLCMLLMVWCVDAVAVSLFLFSCWCCTCRMMCLLYQCWLCGMLMFWCYLWCCCHVVIVISATVIIIMMIMACVPVVLFSSWIWMTRVELLRRSWRMSLWCCSDHGSGRPGLNCYNDHGMCPCGVI